MKKAALSKETTLRIVSVQGIVSIVIVTVLVHAGALLFSFKGSLFPGTDVMMTIITTCSQIIAGLYGITMAGYTFFLSRIDALMASDVTLDYVVASVKNRFKYLIWFITFNVLMVLTTSIVLMYCPDFSDGDFAFFYRLFCNEFVISLGFSVVLILYYSILVIDPNCLSNEAAKLKKKISQPVGLSGSAADFISLYDQIEARCNAMLPQSALHQIHENKGKRFEYTIDLLHEQGLLILPLIHDLKRVHHYYACTINCTPLSVTQEMVTLARRVLTVLNQMNKCRLP